jgi:hypothetical protein
MTSLKCTQTALSAGSPASLEQNQQWPHLLAVGQQTENECFAAELRTMFVVVIGRVNEGAANARIPAVDGFKAN